MLRRQSIVDMVAAELTGHEAAEEQYLWPTVRDELPDAGEWVRHGLQQEQEATETLAALADADPDSDHFDELVERLVLQARKHVAHEERVFLTLRDRVAPERLDELGQKARRAKKVAPTRPHPAAPREPAAAVKAAGAPAAAADKLRDAVGGRPAQRRGKAPGERAAKLEQAREAEQRDDDGSR